MECEQGRVREKAVVTWSVPALTSSGFSDIVTQGTEERQVCVLGGEGCLCMLGWGGRLLATEWRETHKKTTHIVRSRLRSHRCWQLQLFP